MSGSFSLRYLLARELLLVLLFLLVRPGMYATQGRRRRHSSVLMHLCAFGSLGAALLILGSTVFASANVSAYVVHSTLKVRPDDAPHDASSIDIAAARNEFESFQVVVHAGGTDARNVRVAATLTGIPAQNLWLYREAYIDLNPASVTGAVGPWPDPLIPDVDEIYHEQRNAFPFDVAAGKSQAVWIDVLVPADQAPGVYRGTVTVTSDGAAPINLEVRLTVWDFALPSTPSLASAYEIGVDDPCVGHFGAPCDNQKTMATNVMYATFVLDHRITLASAVPPAETESGFDWASWDAAYQPLMEGRAPTRLAGARAQWIQYMWSRKANLLREWTAHVSGRGWLDRAFYIPCDEPPWGCSWDDYVEWTAMVRQAEPDLPLLTTGDVGGSMDKVDADILCPLMTDISPPMTNQDNGDLFRAWRSAAPNRKICWYFACAPCTACDPDVPGAPGHWPNYIIDAPAIDNRIMAWMSFTYDIPMELYYAMAVNYRKPDPWRDVYSYASNGDGVLLYPGTPARIGGQHDIPVASIRLKMIREGREDYEYLRLLIDRGDPELARQLTERIAPRGWQFNSDPNALFDARRRAAERIVELGKGKPPDYSGTPGGSATRGCGASAGSRVN